MQPPFGMIDAYGGNHPLSLSWVVFNGLIMKLAWVAAEQSGGRST